ncbi:hypothetical protein O181_043390 [Austropuccinia psidii MF-1]|uniref:Ubiquinol-cytochrome C reductase hinge domain-containing protein n=1 Tax=Austropuccinia psidii MF-1 TaxID=1389203 RepID=A0A9Q3DMG8_9BASI|nr:hypothetical protein [Austropuccinia psidii MF-1]
MTTSTTSSSSSSSTFSEKCSSFLVSVTDYLIPTVSAEAEQSEEAEEEEDPEDPAPAIREECTESKCSKYKHHFDHCQEKVQSGKGEKGEDCVEEFFHLMHCVDECATPKLASKLV